MHQTELVAIVFKLINFAALIGLGAYLFKRYVLPDIQLDITKRQQKIADLALQNHLLKEQVKAMDVTLSEQQSMRHTLLQKIDLWNALVLHHIQERDQEKAIRQLALAQKMKTQQIYIELHDAQRKALLPAIEKAREVLAMQYTAMPLGQSFIGDIVKHMEKSKL